MKNPNRKTQNGRAPAVWASNRAKSRRVTPKSFDHVQLQGNIIRLNRVPLEIPPDTAVGYLGRDSQGRAVILTSVDNVNKFPKSFMHRIQTVLPFWEPSGEQLILVHQTGRVYAVMHSEPTPY